MAGRLLLVLLSLTWIGHEWSTQEEIQWLAELMAATLMTVVVAIAAYLIMKAVAKIIRVNR